MPALLDNSLKLQDEVTDALGEQVRRAVEVLIQALDRADVDRDRNLLAKIEPATLYEAGLTVMMRIVFLLSAEERGLLLLGDERYETNYAVSTLRMQLRAEPEEILERRFDAWARLLSVFRVVFGGIEHDNLSLPAFGGSLFDPDRFPFLEGRPAGSDWRTSHAFPLPIDNRTVLLLLDAVQLFQGRALSYRALDVEQIGYVYEGLLERTVVRAKEVTLDLNATKNAKKPWVTLKELEAAKSKSDNAVAALLKDRTDSSASRIENDLKKSVEAADADRLLTACPADASLRDRIKPYFHFLRMDRWGYPLVYPIGTFMVRTGTDRRETGTHYTPKSLTEAIVKETLEPIAYVGPAEGKPLEDWVLKSPAELLDLKICDPAMGSGAFLVQVCRWLSERLVEAWREAEVAGNAVEAGGNVVNKKNGYEPLRNDSKERMITARRLIAERCLYGVDVNPLAVELAKLSIWLVTLAKGRPFGFLDHNIRSGDSLLGIDDLDQLHYLDVKPGKGSSINLFASEINQSVAKALRLRDTLRSRPIIDIRDVQAMADTDDKARQELELPGLIADAFVGVVLAAGGKSFDTTSLKITAYAGEADSSDTNVASSARQLTISNLRKRANKDLGVDLAPGKPARKPFHWPLEFPEVFNRKGSGFDAFVGNPPFLGGTRISTAMGAAYRSFLVNIITEGAKGRTDLVAHFFNRAFSCLRTEGCFGFLATNSISEGETRKASLERIEANPSSCIYSAYPSEAWPGKAAVITTRVHVKKGEWSASRRISGRSVSTISSYLSDQIEWTPNKLSTNSAGAFIGSYVNGMGFVLTEEQAKKMIMANSANERVLFPYLNGQDLYSNSAQKASRWIINFWDWPEEDARKFELAYNHLRKHVYQERLVKSAQPSYKNIMSMWWLFWNNRPGLYGAIGRGSSFKSFKGMKTKPLDRVLVCTRVSKTGAFVFVSNDTIYSDALIVFPSSRIDDFIVLQSAIHIVYAWKHSSQLKTDMRYIPTEVYETFPFPTNRTFCSDIQSKGEEFHALRSKVMRMKKIGLTQFYSNFHDPEVLDECIQLLRSLQRVLDEAVCDAYGWNDISLNHGFHKVAYLTEGDNCRFTISEIARVELLARLALLNTERYEAEKRSKTSVQPSGSAISAVRQHNDLFSSEEDR